MNKELLQNEIDKTEYWDVRILDIQTKYYGDEVCVYIENDVEKCWEIKFTSCVNVSYETDANCRSIDNVKNMRNGQLGYFGQKIFINDYNNGTDLMAVQMDFSIMTMNILCKNIEVRECEVNELGFFWNTKL